MNQNPERIIQKYTSISRRIFLSVWLLFFLGGVIAAAKIFLELEWKWLEVTGMVLFSLAELMLALSWITPGILIGFGVPWLAHAWLRGINPVAISDTPWEQLSSGKKVLTYFGLCSFQVSHY
jgi:hypothetical protein